mmetsp:Transcript_105848/g.338035  ORF Transcript_105848/g.338035 Transcript_105848/m.338035 type:complete len:84 (+) Transcript_105848:1069-1320(+)
MTDDIVTSEMDKVFATECADVDKKATKKIEGMLQNSLNVEAMDGVPPPAESKTPRGAARGVLQARYEGLLEGSEARNPASTAR